MILTAGDIQSCCACPRRAYLDMHGDRAERAPLSPFARKLLHDERAHERRVVEALGAHTIGFDGRDADGAAGRTWQAMEAGHAYIAGAVLRAPAAGGEWDRIGVADLLIRVPGKSAFGRYHYEPVEIRTARRVKHPYRLQLAYYGHLLAVVQGRWPERGHLILGDGSRHAVPFRTLRTHYERVLARLEEIRAGDEPPVHITARCLQCSWHPSCLPLARREGHLSLVHGLNRRHAVQLQAHGIRSFQELAACDAEQVAEWIEDTRHRAEALVLQARSLRDDQPVWCRPAGLPAASCEIFFDIEGDPEHDVFYLFGMLHRTPRGEQYVSFLAEAPEAEGRAFLECLTFLEAHAQAPVYHYHDFEVLALRRLAHRHGVRPERIEALRPRLRDLSRDLAEACRLPIPSYSLKSVARYLGFEWSRADSSAVQSVVWFTSWLAEGDRSHLDHAVEYNADDCQATRILKDWLAAGPGASAAGAPPRSLEVTERA